MPEPKARGYSDELRKQALRMYVDGINYRRIGHLLNIHHTSVINWVKVFAAQLPDALIPEELHPIDLDELFSFIRNEKKHLPRDGSREKITLYCWLVGDGNTKSRSFPGCCESVSSWRAIFR
jgi:hypothetical protein